MPKYLGAFSGYSTSDLQATKKFYSETLGLNATRGEMGMVNLELEGGGTVMIYQKDDHTPATYTVLNLAVEDIDAAVDELSAKDVKFEHYDEGMIKTDEKGIARGKAANMGPDIAWFKDPAGNILSILQE